MKTLAAGLQTHFNGEVTSLVNLWRVRLNRHQPRISGITKANPGVVTTKWAHSLVDGDAVYIQDVEGMTEVNKTIFSIDVLTSTTFELDIDTSAFTTYEMAGLAKKLFGFTSHVDDITFEKVKYLAQGGHTPTAIKTQSDFSVDNLDIKAILDSSVILETDIRAGRYDFAEILIAMVNYENLAQGSVILRRGNLGEITTEKKQGMFSAELRGMLHYLQQEIGKHYSAICRVDLGATLCDVRLDPPFWKATTAYTARLARDAASGSVVKPTSLNERHFKCTTAGTSGASEPTWDTTIGNTTADGSVVWTAIDALTKESTITAVIDARVFLDSSANRTEAEGWYTFGLVTMLAGLNVGISREVKQHRAGVFLITAVNTSTETITIAGNHVPVFPASQGFNVSGSTGNDGAYTVASSTYDATLDTTAIIVNEDITDSTADGQIDQDHSFEFLEAFPFALTATEAYELVAGCDKLLQTCIDKFDNVHNYQGEPFVPGQDRMLNTPDAK